jgi:hypothetical protein
MTRAGPSLGPGKPYHEPMDAMVRRTPAPAVVYVVALIALTAAILAVFGRNLWCSVGDLVPWSWETDEAHSSQHLLDPYSFTHFEHGILFFALLRLVVPRASLRARFLAALTIAAGWEILENSSFIIDRYREQTIDAGYYGDSILNSLADMAWCALGFLVTSKVRWWWSLAIMMAFEVGLALTIRDNLFLNILMLIYPVDAILTWQSAR